MRLSAAVTFGLALLATGAIASAGQDLRNGYTVKSPAPKGVTNVCADLAPTFAELRTEIDLMGTQAYAAGKNAVGLGFWSPGNHFHSVEDNYIAINKVLEPSLDEVTDIPIALDQAPSGDPKTAALALGDAYEQSLRGLKTYTQAALVFERAAYGRRNAQVAAISGGGADSRNSNDREMTADEARTILDSKSSDVKDASRALKLPEYRWEKACSSSSGTPDSAPTPAPLPTQSPL